LKYAGYDALIVQGAASEPVSIVIDNDRVGDPIRAASCGARRLQPPPNACGTTSDAIGNRWSSGPPGEKRTNIASIFNDTRALARGGVGRGDGARKI